uniref:Uncharacterized protein n=1 Tax=Opuntia streptacantha TaxID=393608 RepID=A0A7C8Z826_OPUST
MPSMRHSYENHLLSFGLPFVFQSLSSLSFFLSPKQKQLVCDSRYSITIYQMEQKQAAKHAHGIATQNSIKIASTPKTSYGHFTSSNHSHSVSHDAPFCSPQKQ